MIKIENVKVTGFEDAIRGMRNSWNSWDKSDSEKDNIGHRDRTLMGSLCNAGPSHSKFRRMIVAWMDITAPLYWWKEFDTYKVGTVANSCSTMHTITSKEFELDDFSHEHLMTVDESKQYLKREYGVKVPMSPLGWLHVTIKLLNEYRRKFLETDDMKWWWQIIQLLPTSYNQRRTVMLNYEVLSQIYEQRKNHKLDEWKQFCEEVKEHFPNRFLILG